MKRAVRVLSSLWLTIPILLSLAAAIVYASIWQVDPSIGAIRRDVYTAWWFNGLLGALALNISVCTLKRKPFNLVMLGYLVTHIGILTVLAAAMVTNLGKVYGQLVVLEGERESIFQLETKHELRVAVEGEDEIRAFPFPLKPYDPADADLDWPLAGADMALRVTRFEPNVEGRWEYEPADDGVLAIRLRQTFRGATQRTWVERFERVPIGGPGLELSFDRMRSSRFADVEGPAPEEPELIVRYGGAEARIDVTEHLDEPFEVGGAHLRLIRFDPIFTGDDEPLPPEHANLLAEPAVVVEFEPPDGRPERYAVLARHPSVPPVHVDRREPTDLFEAVLRCRIESSGIVLYLLDDGTFGAIETARDGRRATSRVAAGGAFRYEFMPMPLEFAVEEVMESARRVYRVEPAPVRQGMSPNGAVRVELAGPRDRVEGWVDSRGAQTFDLDGREVHVAFGPVQRELPFSVALEEFREEYYPGTTTVRRWESRVRIEDGRLQHFEDRVLAVNEPIVYAGYTLYQASFIRPEQTERGVWGTVIQVSRDPGKPFLYLGAVVAVLGVLYMFYVKPVLVRRRAKAGQGAAA